MRTTKNANFASTLASWRYNAVAILLHWILTILIVGMVALGWFMMSIEDEPGASWYFNLHKSVGLLIFGLVLIRVVWRFRHTPSALPASLPKWQVTASAIAQWLLYGCMVLLPITGFLGASYSKSGVNFFGLQLPSWLIPNHAAAEQFFSAHEALVWLLVTLVALHGAAGLKHLFIDKDNVFQRMWM